MQKLIIKGSKELSGKISISGSKNATLPILAASILSKQAKIKNFLRVVPLFETLDDLINAKDVMKNLFKLSWFRKLINSKQEVMIGYSDSSKVQENYQQVGINTNFKKS